MSRAAALLAFAFVAVIAAFLGFQAGGGGEVRAPVGAPSLAGTPPSLAEVVARVNPAVVHVNVIDDRRGVVRTGLEDAPRLDLPRRGEGSGFLVDPDGYILTNAHLVSGTGRIRVRLADKRELQADRVGIDVTTDLALIKVEARGLPTVKLGDSDRVRVGDWVCAIGNPLEFDHTVTVGVVSSLGRKIFNQSFDAYIQTDAAINPGNSGGPLVNLQGEAIGISSAISSDAEGIGFAVPINVARSVLRQLRERGRVQRGYLGMYLHELDPDLAELVGLSEPQGALVVDVVEEKAAAAAGLRRWDVVVSVSGEPIANGDTLVRTIAALPPGSTVRLGVVRDGVPLSIEARVGERGADGEPGREDARAWPTGTPVRRGDALGLTVADLPARIRAELSLPPARQGVVIQAVLGADPGTDLLEEGDLVVEVNRHPTPDLASYRRVTASLEPGASAWLCVFRPRSRRPFLTRVEVEGRP